MTDDPPAPARVFPSRPVLAAVAVGLLLSWAAPAGAATWYVRQSGNDSNSGTSPGQAFRTLQKAANVDTNSDVVVVGAGTYTESVTGLEDGAAGNLAYWFADVNGTYTGDAGPVVWRPGNGGDHAVRLGNEHHIAFYNFRFRANPNAAGAAGAALPNAYEIYFVDCAFEELTDGLRATDSGGFIANRCTFADCRDGADVRSVAATFTDCTFTGGGSDGIDANSSGLTLTGCTFAGQADAGLDLFESSATLTDCHFSGIPPHAVDCGNAGLTMTDCTVSVPAGAGTIGVDLSATGATLTRCAIAGGGDYGLNRTGGGTLTLDDCTVSDCAVTGVYAEGEDVLIDGCTFAGNATGLHLVRNGVETDEPHVENTTVRDGTTGVYTNWDGIAFRNATLSGHAGAALRVDPAIPAFTLGAVDTVTCAGNAVGLRWDADAAGTESLTVAGQTWADNGVHVRAVRIASADVRDCAFTGGNDGVSETLGSDLTVRGCTFRDIAEAGRGGVRTTAPTLAVTGCLFERCSNGLWVLDAKDPDLRDCTFRDCAAAGIDIRDGAWNWNAADNLAFVGNKIGVYASRLDLNVDGGAAGIEIVGPASGGHGLYAHVGAGRSLTCRNLRARSCAIGLRVVSPNGATLDDCSAADCSSYGAHLAHDPGDTAPVAAVVRNFTATDCANGLAYVRQAGVPAGRGQIELRGITATKSVAVDADGYPGATSGTGIYLYGCPLDPAHHADLAVEGFHRGVYVRDAPATLTAAMNVDPSRCRNGVIVVAGALTATGYVSAGTHYGLYLVPNGRPVALAGCRLTARDRAVFVRNGGDLTADGCAFESPEADGVLYSSAAAPTAALTDCTATAPRGDGFRFFGGAGGALSFTDCRVTDAGSDGFELVAAAGGGGTATFTRCTVDRARDQGFEISNVPTAFRGCAVTNAAGGYFLGDCPASEMAACRVADCTGGGVLLRGTTALEAANLLAVRCYVGLTAEADGPVVLNHATLAATRDALKVGAGEVTVRNSVLVAGDDGCDRNGGSVAFDHVLIHAPTPYEGATGGPDDVLADPRFRDPAAGDYRLAEGSPAINVGADLTAVTDDLNGLPRPAHRRHDLGAYEYQEAGGSLRILDWKERAQ